MNKLANLAHQQLPRQELSVLQEAGYLQQRGTKLHGQMVTIWLASGRAHTANWAMNEATSTGQLHKAQHDTTRDGLAQPAHRSERVASLEHSSAACRCSCMSTCTVLYCM